MGGAIANSARCADAADQSAAQSAIAVVIPFYNEENFIAATLDSLAAQRARPAMVILVDNASIDRSVDVCEDFNRRRPEIPLRIVREERPGKINALETGLKFVATPFVAFCDADTYYPPHYFELALALFEKSGENLVGAMGLGLSADPQSVKGAFQRWKGSLVGAALARQCHTGGYGQIFRTQTLRRSGGYSRDLWPFMQADHEVVHRLLKHGACAYHPDLWCRPSTRRTDRRRVSWTLFEIAVYHLTPFALKDWYYYDFLRSRFIARDMMNVNLRHQPWTEAERRAPPSS